MAQWCSHNIFLISGLFSNQYHFGALASASENYLGGIPPELASLAGCSGYSEFSNVGFSRQEFPSADLGF
jgi:hypothetical protein